MASPHNERSRSLIFFLILLLTCTAVSYLTTTWVVHQGKANEQPVDYHQWLHDELQLTTQEEERIQDFEAGYHEQRQAMLLSFEAKKQDLATILRQTSTKNNTVTHAVHELHLVHGQLQQLSIDHYYNMLNVLPPEKQKILSNLAVEALSQPE